MGTVMIMWKNTAPQNNASISSICREYMERVFEELDEQSFFDKIFYSILGQTIKVNRVFLTYQLLNRSASCFHNSLCF